MHRYIEHKMVLRPITMKIINSIVLFVVSVAAAGGLL